MQFSDSLIEKLKLKETDNHSGEAIIHNLRGFVSSHMELSGWVFLKATCLASQQNKL